MSTNKLAAIGTVVLVAVAVLFAFSLRQMRQEQNDLARMRLIPVIIASEERMQRIAYTPERTEYLRTLMAEMDTLMKKHD